MGILMGREFENAAAKCTNPDVWPNPLELQSYPPNLGFKGQERQERKITATEQQMYSAKIPIEDRDFCADFLLKYAGCRKREWPWVARCYEIKEEFLQCKYEDYVLRMKEYERERRINQMIKDRNITVDLPPEEEDEGDECDKRLKQMEKEMNRREKPEKC